eukprot:2507827-Rhodomonas_salina.1
MEDEVVVLNEEEIEEEDEDEDEDEVMMRPGDADGVGGWPDLRNVCTEAGMFAIRSVKVVCACSIVLLTRRMLLIEELGDGVVVVTW